MSRQILGLDIRHHTLTAILVRTGLKGSWIEAVIQTPLAVPEGEALQESTALEAALKEVYDQLGKGGAAPVAALPADQFSFRNVHIPFKESRKIRQVLPFELEPTLPRPVDEVVIDFRVIHLPSQEEGANIIAAALENERMSAYLASLSAARLAPDTVSLSGYAAALCLAKWSDIAENCLFMDIDLDHCTLYILISGQVYLIRPIQIRPGGGDPVDKTKALCAHIRRTLAAFEALFHLEFELEEVHVTGWGLADLDFEGEAPPLLGVPVKRVDLAADAGLPRKMAAQGTMPPAIQINTALGLALAEIEGLETFNFRKGPFSVRKRWAEHRGNLIRTGILALVMLIVLFANIMMDVNATERRVAHIDREIREIFQSTFPEITRIVDPLHQMEAAMTEAKQNAALPGEGKGDIRSIDILHELSRLIPEKVDVIVTRMVIGEESVLISGDTDTFNAVDEIQNRLEGSELFGKVTISSTNRERSGNRIQFKMRITL
jgi:type II secretory pathway component PulL